MAGTISLCCQLACVDCAGVPVLHPAAEGAAGAWSAPAIFSLAGLLLLITLVLPGLQNIIAYWRYPSYNAVSLIPHTLVRASTELSSKRVPRVCYYACAGALHLHGGLCTANGRCLLALWRGQVLVDTQLLQLDVSLTPQQPSLSGACDFFATHWACSMACSVLRAHLSYPCRSTENKVLQVASSQYLSALIIGLLSLSHSMLLLQLSPATLSTAMSCTVDPLSSP